MPLTSGGACNHGLVEIDDNGYVNGETPVEDFGMFFYRDEPFPQDPQEIAQIFFQLMEDAAHGMDDPLDEGGPPIRELLTTDEGRRRIWDHHYYGGDLKEGILGKLFPLVR